MNYSHITMRTEENLVVMVMDEMSPTVFWHHRRRGGRGPLLLLLPWPSGGSGTSPLDWISLLSSIFRDCFRSPSPFLIFPEIRNSDWAEILTRFLSGNYRSCGERRAPTDLRGTHKATRRAIPPMARPVALWAPRAPSCVDSSS